MAKVWTFWHGGLSSCWKNVRVPAQVLATQFPTQFPGNGPGKEGGNGSRTWAPATHKGDPDGVPHPGQGLAMTTTGEMNKWMSLAQSPCFSAASLSISLLPFLSDNRKNLNAHLKLRIISETNSQTKTEKKSNV